tara:strand:- start:83 stop:298 length:216 start_codon:yes stop_codon:yes gene_type:complete
MARTRESQKRKILRYLEEGNRLNPMQALNLFGCFRLSAVIFDIRADKGYEYVKTNKVENRNGNKYAEYTVD